MRDNLQAPAPGGQPAFCKASPLAHLLRTIRGSRTGDKTLQPRHEELKPNPCPSIPTRADLQGS